MERIKLLFVFVLLISLTKGVFSQGSKCNYAKDPCWIAMMDNPNVNYFEAQKAFDEFWKARGGEPFVSENVEEKKRYDEQKRSAKQKKEQAEKQKYVVEYRRFKQWQKNVEPYVQPDGTILSEKRREEIYENQRK